MAEFAVSLFVFLLRIVSRTFDLVILLVAYAVMGFFVKRDAIRQGIDRNLVADLSFWVAAGAVVGGRLGYVLPSLSTYLAYPVDLIRINTGMYFYGALVGSTAVGLWYHWRRRIHFWMLADLFGLYVLLSIAIARFSCVLRSGCFGRQAPPPLGILFSGLTQPRYPSELYEGLFALLIFGSFLWVRQQTHRPGTVFLRFLVAYPLARAVVDVTRVSWGSRVWVIDPVLSLVVTLGAALVLFLRAPRRGPHHPALARPGNGA